MQSQQVSSYIMVRTSFQLYHGENKFPAISLWEQVNFQWDDDEVRFVLDQQSE